MLEATEDLTTVAESLGDYLTDVQAKEVAGQLSLTNVDEITADNISEAIKGQGASLDHLPIILNDIVQSGLPQDPTDAELRQAAITNTAEGPTDGAEFAPSVDSINSKVDAILSNLDSYKEWAAGSVDPEAPVASLGFGGFGNKTIAPYAAEYKAAVADESFDEKPLPLSDDFKAAFIATVKRRNDNNFVEEEFRIYKEGTALRESYDRLINAPMSLEVLGDGRYGVQATLHIDDPLFEGYSLEFSSLDPRSWPSAYAKVVDNKTGGSIFDGQSSQPQQFKRIVQLVRGDFSTTPSAKDSGDAFKKWTDSFIGMREADEQDRKIARKGWNDAVAGRPISESALIGEVMGFRAGEDFLLEAAEPEAAPAGAQISGLEGIDLSGIMVARDDVTDTGVEVSIEESAAEVLEEKDRQINAMQLLLGCIRK